MSSQNFHIKVQKTARYWVSGSTGQSVHTVVFVLHGYGMAALTCLEDFSGLMTEHVLLVAPEGLSRFYRKGFDGDVVASWMTREDRMYEIEDQAGYLDNLLATVLSELAPQAKRVVVVGYSQGVATGSRWIHRRMGKGISDFVIYAGTMAPETLSSEWPAGVKVLQVSSDTDEFISSSDFHEQFSKLQAANASVRQLTYQGKHVIDPVAVSGISNYLWNQHTTT